MFKASGRGFKRPFCINEACPNFLPEDKRGYRKKTNSASGDAAADEPKKAGASQAKKSASGKATAKKPAAKKARPKKPATRSKSTKAKAPAAGGSA
jgi:DNA topoisomerase-1